MGRHTTGGSERLWFSMLRGCVVTSALTKKDQARDCISRDRIFFFFPDFFRDGFDIRCSGKKKTLGLREFRKLASRTTRILPSGFLNRNV